MASAMVALVVGVLVVVVVAVGIVATVVLRAIASRRRMQAALEASIRREARQTEMARPRVRAGTSRAEDWRYAGSGRGHIPPRELPPRPKQD